MKALGLLLSSVMWVLVACSVVLIAGSLLGRPLLLAAVPTGSMMPVIAPGDLVVVLPSWLAASPRVGDIVVFQTSDEREWIVHRVVQGGATEGFVTKGDANPQPDSQRVFPRHIGALVPQIGESTLRIPGLGLLRVASGPLSSPVIAGVALLLGIYLLVQPAKTRSFRPVIGFSRRQSARPEATLSLYFGLAASAFLATLLPAWAMTTTKPIKYEVVESIPTSFQTAGRHVRGQLAAQEVTVQNTSFLPLLVQFVADNPRVSYEPEAAIVAPWGEAAFQVRLDTMTLGTNVATVYSGTFLPLLPTEWMTWLGRQSLALAALTDALVPALVLLAIAALDPRSYLALRRIRTRLATRLSA
ncbi:MAG: signal peptidase I [Chloroflexi bacterium]|nr:signal peptidase I [Chloroflexota bacterium]